MAQANMPVLMLFKLLAKSGVWLFFVCALFFNSADLTYAQVSKDPQPSMETGALPLTSEQHSDFGALSLLKGKPSDAIASYTSALKDQRLSNDRRASLLNDRAVAYVRDGQIKLALEDFNVAAQLYPEYAPIYNNRGTLLVSLEQYKEALKDFNRALLLSPNYAAAFNNRASLYLKLGQKGEALEDFIKALESAPQSPELFNSRGRANLELKRPLSAIRDFTHSLSLDDKFSEAYRNRGLGKFMLQAYPEAIEDYSRGLVYNAEDPELYFLRGEAYLAIDEPNLALKDLNRAINLNSKFEAAYVERSLTNITNEKYEDALSDINRTLEINPSSAKAFAVRALIEIKKAEIDLAKKDIMTALELDGKLAEALWAKAVLDDHLGQKDDALASLAQALELKPWHKDALELQYKLSGGKVEETLETLDETARGSIRLVRTNGQFFAQIDLYPRLILPLEMLEDVPPKIGSWEVKQAPFEGYGVLKYIAGNISTPRGLEECEMSMLVDLNEQRVVAVLPERQGSKSSVWKWENDKIIISALDGITEEFPLLAESRIGEVAARKGDGVSSVSRRYAKETVSNWAPWNQPLGVPDGGERRKRKTNYKSPQWKGAKSLFDFLFN